MRYRSATTTAVDYFAAALCRARRLGCRTPLSGGSRRRRGGCDARDGERTRARGGEVEEGVRRAGRMRVGRRRRRERGEGARARAARAAREWKGVIRGKPWKRGLRRAARTCMRSARRSLRSRSACAACFSLDSSRRTRRRLGRGELGGEPGPPTVDAPAARADVASASAPASTSESLLPAGRHIDGRDTEVGIAASNGKIRTRGTRATRGVVSLDASTRGRYCRGTRPSRQSRVVMRDPCCWRGNLTRLRGQGSRCVRGRAAVRGRRYSWPNG